MVLTIYDATGTLASTSGNQSLGIEESVLFATSTLSNFSATVVLTSGVEVGYATIEHDVGSKVNCSAFLVHNGSSSIASLTVVKKTKQKGD